MLHKWMKVEAWQTKHVLWKGARVKAKCVITGSDGGRMCGNATQSAESEQMTSVTIYKTNKHKQ